MHPGPTVGLRLQDGRAHVAYLPDHEPALAGLRGCPRAWISGAAVAEDADLLFHDAQYFAEEYDDRIGWGHSSVDDAVAFARVGARRLVLFHHEPSTRTPTSSGSGTGRRARGERRRRDGDRTEGMVVEVP